MNFKKLSKLLEEVNGEKPYKVSTKGPDDDRVVDEIIYAKDEEDARQKTIERFHGKLEVVNVEEVPEDHEEVTEEFTMISQFSDGPDATGTIKFIPGYYGYYFETGQRDFDAKNPQWATIRTVEGIRNWFRNVLFQFGGKDVYIGNHHWNINDFEKNESLNEEVEETKNYKRERQTNPKTCKEGSFRTKEVNDKGDKVVLCKDRKTNKMKAQSILKKKNESVEGGKEFLKRAALEAGFNSVEELASSYPSVYDIMDATGVAANKEDLEYAQKLINYALNKNNESLNEVNDEPEKFKYMLLDRLKQDCLYYIDNNGSNSLWAKTVDDQIANMKQLWNELKIKPEWLTMEKIEEFEKQMHEIEAKKNVHEECDVCKIKMLNRLDHIVKHCQDGELKQRATSLLDNLGMGVDVKEEAEKLFNEIDSKKSKKEKEDEMKPEEKITNNAIKGLMEELEELLNEVEGVELKAEPKRYIVQQIDREHDDVRQEEFDNIVHAVNAYNTLKNSHLLTELVDTKTDEILATNGGHIDESVGENKKAQILGYNNGVAKVVFEHPITNEYSLEDFQNDRINIIDNNKDFQNFETRIVDIDESINEDIIDDIDVPAVIEEPVEEIEVNTEEIENNEEKDPEIEEIADEIMDKIEDAVEERIEGDAEEDEDEITEPAEEDELFVLEDYKQYLRKGKYEDLQDTKREIDKAAQQGKSPEEVKAVIDIKSDDDKEKEEAEKYAVDKLTESLLATAKTSKLKDLKK